MSDQFGNEPGSEVNVAAPGPIGAGTPSTIAGTTITATVGFSGPGGSLTGLSATALTSGVVAKARGGLGLDLSVGLTGDYVAIVSGGALGVGPLTVAAVPNLDTSKITTGVFTSSQIPSLDASKISSGTLSVSRIPSLDVSQVTTGTFAASFIPGLDAGKITTGTLAKARGGFAQDLSTGLTNDQVAIVAGGALTVGALTSAAVPNLDAGKITTGTFDPARIPAAAPAAHAASHRAGGTDDLLSAPGAIGGGTAAAGTFTTLAGTVLTASTRMQTPTVGTDSTHQLTIPAVNADTLALLAAAQEFTSKTLTGAVVKNGLTATGSSANDFSGSSGTFLTSTGNVTVGPGAVSVTGNLTLSTTKTLVAGANTLVGTTADKLNGVHLVIAGQQAGDLYQASGTTTMSRLAIGSANQIAVVNGDGSALTYSSTIAPSVIAGAPWFTGTIAKYNGDLTGGTGIPYLVAGAQDVASSGAGAQNTAITSFAPTVSGTYRVTVVASSTTTDVTTCAVTFTDAINNTAESVTVINATTIPTNGTTSGTALIRATTSTSIVVKITISSQSTTKASATIERLI